MFSIDRLRASRFFWHRHKGVGKTERCSCRAIIFSLIEYVELRRGDFFQASEIAIARVFDAFLEASGVLQKAERHIGVYRRLVLDQYDDLSVDEAGDVIAESYIHHLFEPERFELDRCVEFCPMQCVVESEKIRFCVFAFAEEIDENRIFVPPIVCCRTTLFFPYTNPSKYAILLAVR